MIDHAVFRKRFELRAINAPFVSPLYNIFIAKLLMVLLVMLHKR